MLLTICIATRNRGHIIGETLDSLLLDLPESVEILVVDGASTDNTEQVLTAYSQRYSQLRYVRLHSNGGVDLDYHRAVEHALGDFCWLMTDDDLVVSGGVRAVLAQLTDSVDLVIVNSCVHDETFSDTLQRRRLELTENRTFSPGDFEEFFRICAKYMSFIGSVVIRRGVWLQREYKPYLGTEFIHCGIIFQHPLERNVCVIAEPIIRIRYGVAQWSSRAFQIWMFKWPELIWSFPAFSTEAKETVVPREPWHELHRLLYYRALGQYSPEVYSSKLADRHFQAGLRLLAKAIAHLPGDLWCNAFAIAAALLLPEEKMLQVDLRGSRFYRRKLATPVQTLAAMSGRFTSAFRSLASSR